MPSMLMVPTRISASPTPVSVAPPLPSTGFGALMAPDPAEPSEGAAGAAAGAGGAAAGAGAGAAGASAAGAAESEPGAAGAALALGLPGLSSPPQAARISNPLRATAMADAARAEVRDLLAVNE